MSEELCFSSSSAGGMIVPNNAAFLARMLVPKPIRSPVPLLLLGAAGRQEPRRLPHPPPSPTPALARWSRAAAGCTPRGEG